MYRNPDTNDMKIEKIVDCGVEEVVLECKIHTVEELRSEMKWLDIPVKIV